MSDAKGRHLRVVRPGERAASSSAFAEIQSSISHRVAEIHQEYRRQVDDAAQLVPQYLADLTSDDHGRAR